MSTPVLQSAPPDCTVPAAERLIRYGLAGLSFGFFFHDLQNNVTNSAISARLRSGVRMAGAFGMSGALMSLGGCSVKGMFTGSERRKYGMIFGCGFGLATAFSVLQTSPRLIAFGFVLGAIHGAQYGDPR